MKNRIFFSIVILMILTSIISSAIIMQQAYNFYVESAKQNLINLGATFNAMEEDKYSTILSEFEKSMPNINISIVDNAGKLLNGKTFDFDKILFELSPEIIQLKESGSGFSTRICIDNRKYIFYAIKLNTNVVIRFAQPVNGVWNNIAETAVLNIAFLLLIASIISHYISKKLVEPINYLSDSISSVADGDYSVNAPKNASKEIGRLIQSYNKMAGSLKENVAMMHEHSSRINQIIRNVSEGFIALDKNLNIELINNRAIDYLNYKGFVPLGKTFLMVSRNATLVSCIHDVRNNGQPGVTDIESNRRDIRVFVNPVEYGGYVLFLQNVTKIKRIENMRSEFTANVSHELKTPLTSIKGFAETLKNGAINDKETAISFLDIITVEADRLSNLINDILQLSEIETMKVDTKLEEFNICGILMQVKSILKPTADKMNVIINVECEPLKVKANPDRVKQLFLNLVENAIKYNKEGGEVYCTMKSEGIFAVISIKDTGIGISDADLARIFERFYRADKSRSKKLGGTGLGLSIVKHIVNLYGGSIEVNSNTGEGTEFIVSLPIIDRMTSV